MPPEIGINADQELIKIIEHNFNDSAKSIVSHDFQQYTEMNYVSLGGVENSEIGLLNNQKKNDKVDEGIIKAELLIAEAYNNEEEKAAPKMAAV